MSADEALRDAWLAEMWKPCRELSRAERMEQREADAMAREALHEPVHFPVERAS